MANLSLTRVNKKLNHARFLLDASSDCSASPIQIEAVLESVAFHLICAYRHYLRELIEAYGLKGGPSCRTEVDVIKIFEESKKYPAEALELLELKKEPFSWLCQLENYYESLWGPTLLKQPSNTVNAIALVDLDAQTHREIGLETAKCWVGEFVALVQRQRETSAEF